MRPVPEMSDADRESLLGRAWLDRGRDAIALTHLQRALALDAGHGEAHRQLAYWHVRRSDFRSAVDHLAMAVAARPSDGRLQEDWRLVRALAGLGHEPVDLPSHPEGRLKFRTRDDRAHHRSGWRDAMRSLHPLHNADGVLFEGFIDEPFAIQHPRSGIRSGPGLLEALRRRTYDGRLTSEELHVVPFTEPWVGFLHNPPDMPRWFHYDKAPQTIFAKPVWQESLRHCRGLFTLSEYLANWLRQATGKPVSALIHPTVQPSVSFSVDRFLANPDKRIVQAGWWLRSLSAIFRLPLGSNPLGYRKLRLVPNFAAGADAHLRELLGRECTALGITVDPGVSDVETCAHIPNDAYDDLLAENIVFVELYDASANNTVVECIARATPLLINPLPAVVEYLGERYPLYYTDLADAAAKAMDVGRLRAAHEYLLGCDTRDKLDLGCFRRSVEASEVYQQL